MLVKYTMFDPFLPDGSPSLSVLPPAGMPLQKTAGTMPVEIANFISSMERIDGSMYFLSNALGNEEKWGANKNGDTFPDDQLDTPATGEWGYKTFVTVAKPFRAHKNKDPSRAYGDIPFAYYDKGMGRVYVIMRIDTNGPHFHEIEDVIQAHERGDPVATSMGARVPYDICSICGNKATSRAQYCIHAREQLGTIYPDGRRVFVRNIRPVFFDNSFVTVGADPAAFILSKVASKNVAIPSVDMGAMAYGPDGGIAKTASVVTADIEKNVPGVGVSAPEVQPALSEEESHDQAFFCCQLAPLLQAREPVMPAPVLNGLSTHPLSIILRALGFLGVALRPPEFQRIVLVKAGHEKLADLLDAHGHTFETLGLYASVDALPDTPAPLPVAMDLVNTLAKTAMFKGGATLLDARSAHRPFLLKRAYLLCKDAAMQDMTFGSDADHPDPSASVPMTLAESLKTTAPVVATAGGLYLGARALAQKSPLADAISSSIKSYVGKYKYLIPLLLAGTLSPYIGEQLFEQMNQPETGPAIPGITPEAEIKTAVPAVVNSAALRWGTGVPAAYLGSGYMTAKERSGQRLSATERFIKDNPGKIGVGYGIAGGVPFRAAAKALRGESKKNRWWQKRSSPIQDSLDKLAFLISGDRFVNLPPKEVDDAIYDALHIASFGHHST